MKKLKILLTVFLIMLSVCVFVNMQTAKAAAPSVPPPALNPSSSIGLGSSVTASVTISGSIGTPTGSVTFQYSLNSGSTWTNLGTAVALVGGSATSTSYTPTAPGSNYQFRAIYGGDVNYNSTIGGSVTLTVNKATATVGTASFAPASPITLGGSVTVSVSVSGPGGVASPTGNVQFQVKIGAGSFTNFGSAVALSSGSASLSYTPQTATTYNFQAVYQGDGNYNSGTTGLPSGTLTVNKATPTIAAPTLNAIKVRATMYDGAKVDLVITGNMTISQILNVRIATYQSSTLISVTFTVVGENGTAGFCNMTIPRSVVSNGQSPVVFIDGQKAQNQGYNRDADNFYVWFTTAFSIHHVTTQFTLPSISSSISIGPLIAFGITVPEIVTIYIVIAIRRLRRTPDKI